MWLSRADKSSSAFFNDVTYVRPKVPTLFTALTAGELANDPRVYGVNANAFVLKKNDVVEIVLNSLDPGKHPFHLHGHYFQTVVRGIEEGGTYLGNDTLPEVPMKRDTVLVRPNSYLVIRFRADNPDKYFASVISQRLLTLHTGLAIPLSHRMACRQRPCRNNDRSS